MFQFVINVFLPSLILFEIMQTVGVPISNLARFETKYDLFSFHKNKTSAGFNILYNVAISNIFIFCLYGFHMVDNKYLCWIVPAYLAIRYVVIFLLERLYLLNLRYEFVIVFLTISSNIFVYYFVIKKNLSVAFAFEEFKNQIELLLTLLVYDVFKNIIMKSFDNRDNTSHRERYITKSLSLLKTKYQTLIANYLVEKYKTDFANIKDKHSEILNMLYAIMIYENFSRPKITRSIEFLVSKFSDRTTLSTGIMQIQNKTDENDKRNDATSIYSAVDIILNIMTKNQNVSIYDIAKIYNPSDGNKYALEVAYIYNILISKQQANQQI